MSTHIKTIKGQYESKTSTIFRPKYENCKMSLTRYWGGKKGRMLQLTIENNDDGYIQLTEKQTMKLAHILLNSFNNNKYPSE